jgi:hypothetical protein
LTVAKAHPGLNINLLTDNHAYDKASGTAVVFGTPVTIEAVSETEQKCGEALTSDGSLVRRSHANPAAGVAPSCRTYCTRPPAPSSLQRSRSQTIAFPDTTSSVGARQVLPGVAAGRRPLRCANR